MEQWSTDDSSTFPQQCNTSVGPSSFSHAGVVPKPAFLDRMWGLEPGLLTRLPSLDVPPELSRVLRHVAIACVSAYLYGYHLSYVCLALPH